MQCRRFFFVFLLLAGCGSGAPKDHPPTPLIDIAQGEKAPPVDTGDKDTSDVDRIPRANVFESPDICLKKMRDGRGLLTETMIGEDGQLYTQALAAERAENLDNARRSYLKLLQSFPQSALVPHAYFAFGELFYREMQGDPMKGALAEQSFKEVMKYPAPKNTTMAFTIFRLAQLYATQGKGPEALNMLRKFGDLNETQPEPQCWKALGDSSRKLMATAYADAGQPERAFAFFSRSMGDRGPDRTNAYETLANLGDVYIRRQKPEDAAAALAAAGEDPAPWAFCEREEKIIAAISPSIPIASKDKLVRLHAARCQQQ